MNYKLKLNYLACLCEKINMCIDYMDYKNQYLCYEKIRNHLKKNTVKSKKTQKTISKKGTIPFYFKKNTEVKQSTRDTISNYSATTSDPSQVESLINGPQSQTFFRDYI